MSATGLLAQVMKTVNLFIQRAFRPASEKRADDRYELEKEYDKFDEKSEKRQDDRFASDRDMRKQ